MSPAPVCKRCGLIVDAGGHSTGGVACLERQLAAARAELTKANGIVSAAEEYLKAHAALIAAGVTPERPAAATRLADAWIALNKASEARRMLGPGGAA